MEEGEPPDVGYEVERELSRKEDKTGHDGSYAKGVQETGKVRERHQSRNHPGVCVLRTPRSLILLDCGRWELRGRR